MIWSIPKQFYPRPVHAQAGELKKLVPAYTIEDERNYVKLSLNNLYLSPHFQDISCILFPHENSLSDGNASSDS